MKALHEIECEEHVEHSLDHIVNDLHYPEGIKWTKQRKAVYRILSEAQEPLNAVEIYHKVEQMEGKSEYAISTIYRILATFEEHELLIKQNFMNEDTYVYELNRGSHIHYAVCMNCHKRVALEGCPFLKMKLPKAQDDFQITGHKLELYGYCKECRDLVAEQ